MHVFFQVRLEKLPSVYEWIVISYVTTFAIEKVGFSGIVLSFMSFIHDKFV